MRTTQILLLLLLAKSLFAQIENCFFDIAHIDKLQSSSAYQESYTAFDTFLLSGQTRSVTNTVLTVPVVIHIMHLPEDAVPGTGSNPTDEVILQGIELMNDAFRNENAYAGGPYFTDAGVVSKDVEIEFCLAQQDADGLPFSGIYRTPTDYSDLESNEATQHDPTLTQERYLQSLSYLPSTDYMNIWLVNSICAYENVNCGISGYAYTPGAHGQVFDGIIMKSVFWGGSEEDVKVQVHEAGHYLGLYHTFQGACSETDCITGGDRVCDTPPDSSTGATCGMSSNSCSNDSSIANSPFTSDVEDIYENYMDYGSMSCQNTFTQGQKDRMRNALETTRSSLLSSVACQASGALPLHALILNAVATEKEVLLSWEAVGEEEDARFTVERASDGLNFSIAGETRGLEFTDAEFLPGLSFYRIKHTGALGNTLYSNVKSVVREELKQPIVYPNPLGLADDLFLNIGEGFEQESLNWQITDLQGKTYPTKAVYGEGVVRFSVSQLPQGVYYLSTRGVGFSPVKFIKW